MKRTTYLATASTLALLLTGCGIKAESAVHTNGGGTAPNLAKACAASTKRDGVVHCTKLFSGAKPIRLPGDPSRTQRYGALKRGGGKFHTRAGDLPFSAAVARQLNMRVRGGGPAYASTIYLATISNGTVVAVKSVISVDENALLRAVFAGRVMEGTIGTHTGSGDYTTDKTLPVRIEFAAAPAGGRLAGKITNATTAVRSAGGACLAPLNRTSANPLVGIYTANVAIQRRPAMHVQYDDELILIWTASASNMGTSFFPSIATLLGGDPLGRTWATVLHGTPTAGPAVTVHLVRGGGGTC